jgi:hypothetical protein
MMAMSAANATDDNRDAAPAATRDLTLRIGFVLLAGEATTEASHQKLTIGRCLKILKRHLTLIIKVDNPLRTTCPACAVDGEITRNFNRLPNRRAPPKRTAIFFDRF